MTRLNMWVLPASALLCAPGNAPAQTTEPEPPIATMQDEEEESIIVQATRSGRRMQDEPVRVEVINREEIEEKILMRPGNIATILSETGGLRVQVTSPALGAANVRTQGMDGRFTQLLADGLPLYGGQASSLGLLQIPPTDLGQVEVIKGAASALYGPSALGGVINLVSRRPGKAPEAEMLLNATSRGGQDATAYLAAPLGGDWSASLTGGAHRQDRQDLDGDGWIDMPSYRRWTVRPRLFWNGADGASLFVTASAMSERRNGGTLPGRTTPDGNPFPQVQDTDRLDGGFIMTLPVDGVGTMSVRASGVRQKHLHQFGSTIDNDQHRTLFSEASVTGADGDIHWVAGIAYQEDRFRSDAFPLFDYSYGVPGVFGQVEQKLGSALTLASSARIDFHNRYGTQLSPRLSLLYRPGPWTIRLSGGHGFYATSPFVEQIEAAGLSRLEPLQDLKAEQANTASMDVGYKNGPFEANMTLFASNRTGMTTLRQVSGPDGSDRVELMNIAGTARIRGMELLLRRRWGGLSLTGSYVYLSASEPDPDRDGRRTIPLTPDHSASLVAMWEERGKGRLGLEVYYTGRQSLDDNPYRITGRPYFEIGLMGEIAVGGTRLFVNAENILNVRQTRYDPLPRPDRAADGRWTVDAWGPIEGFVLNAGVRLKFGGGG